MADDVILPVKADTTSAEKSLDDFAKSSTTAGDVFKGALGAQAAAAVIKGFGEAFKDFVGFFSDGVGAAERQQQAMTDLEVQLSLTGDASAEALSQFNGLAAEMELLTGVDDNLIVSQAALAKSFGITNEQAIDLVRAASELSAVTGKGLQASIEELGKTYTGVGGRTATLKSATDGLTKSQLESGAAIQAVLDAFGGTAAARVDTFAGQSRILATQIGNLGENFGEVIVKSPQFTAAIKEMINFVVFLQETVVENQDTLLEWAQFGLLASASAMSTALDVTKFFVDGLQGLINISGLVLTGFGIFTDFMIDVWDTTIGNSARIILTLLEATGAVEEGTVDSFNEMIKGAKTFVNEVTDDIAEFTAGAERRADATDKFFNSAGDAIDGATDRILDAQNRQVGSMNKLVTASRGAAKQQADDAKKVAKAMAEAAKLESEILKSSETELEKSARIRDEFNLKIEDQLNQGVITQEKSAQLSLQVESDYQESLKKITDAAEKERNDQTQKNAEEARKRVEAAVSDPISFIIKEDLSAKDVAPLGVGIGNSILDGAAGAQDLLATGAGAIADTFLPGIGGGVSALVSQLAKGPEENKKMIQGFVEAAPALIEAIADSIPVIVETLIEELIVKGGLFRIAVALVKAMVTVWISLAKVMAVALLRDIVPGIGGAISGGFSDLPEKLHEAFKPIIEFDRKVREAAINFARQIFSGIQQGAQKLFEFDARLRNAAIDAGRKLFEGLVSGFRKVQEIDKRIRDAVIGAFKNIKLPTGIFSQFTKAIGNLFKTPSWIKQLTKIANFFNEIFNSVLDFFSGFSIGGGGGGGVLGFAGGLTEVPGGFPSDTFGPVGLTSFERIVSAPQNQDLGLLLDDYNRGLLSLEGQNQGGGEFDPRVLELLARIANQLENGQGDVVVKINERELARAQLGNARRNARTG